MKLRAFSRAAAALLLVAGICAAQSFRGVRPASVMPIQPVEVTAGKTFEVVVPVQIRPGYHMNSDAPHEEYLIPTKLEWTTPGFEVESVSYPEAEDVNYSFSEKPLSVFTGKILIRSKLRAPSAIVAGTSEITGKLRYQACTDKACLAPRTVDVTVGIRP